MVTLAPSSELYKRQLWALPTPTATSTSEDCKIFTLPLGGSLIIDNSSTIALTSTAVYQPPCSGSPAFLNSADNGTQPIDRYRDPFYASVTPQVYIVALTTAMAWLLLIILLMFQPSYHGLSTRPLVQAWRRGDGIISLFTSRASPLPLGNRPWLQRLAALMVVISLTTVTADTFRNAQEQYESGYSDATELRNEVSGSIEVRVIRVISDLFLWLAQIQTLIRLFPRRKEKLVIKWVGFVLILLDIIFSCLNSFLIDAVSNDDRPRRYRDAIPALSYLFQLALNLLYAAWVLYFVMTKRRYAFYHHLMPEICIVAAIALVSLVVPVVFFLVDILESDVSAWGDYFRWIGSASASIIVWEWVERIDFLEREEKKDGILGREIFEEDDVYSRPPHRGQDADGLSTNEKDSGLGKRYMSVKHKYSKFGDTIGRLASGKGRERKRQHEPTVEDDIPSRRDTRKRRRQQHRDTLPDPDRIQNINAPAPVASPFDRVDANSPSSTIYTVQYHPNSQTPPAFNSQTPPKQGENRQNDAAEPQQGAKDLEGNAKDFWKRYWPVIAFRRSRQSPPVEVKNALSLRAGQRIKPSASSRGRLSGALSGLSPRQEEDHPSSNTVNRQPTVIEPPARGTLPWTPESFRRAPQGERIREVQTGIEAASCDEEEDTSPGQSDAHDFAATASLSARVNTPAGNLSGSTALNQSASSEEQFDSSPGHESSGRATAFRDNELPPDG